jgi:hypothetical protein
MRNFCLGMDSWKSDSGAAILLCSDGYLIAPSLFPFLTMPKFVLELYSPLSGSLNCLVENLKRNFLYPTSPAKQSQTRTEKPLQVCSRMATAL